MRRRQRTLVEHLTRSLAASAVVYAAFAAYLLPAALLVDRDQDRTRGVAPESSVPREHPSWRSAYGQRYPGCGDLSDWPGESPPRTVVVLTRDGGLARLPYREAYRRTTTPASADDVWTVGACR